MKKNIIAIMCKINHIIHISSKIVTQLIGADQGTHGKAILAGIRLPHRVSNLAYGSSHDGNCGFSPYGQRSMRDKIVTAGGRLLAGLPGGR
jgi:hypothetical protein